MKESRYSRWLLSQETVLSGLKEEEVAFELDLEVKVKIRYGQGIFAGFHFWPGASIKS